MIVHQTFPTDYQGVYLSNFCGNCKKKGKLKCGVKN